MSASPGYVQINLARRAVTRRDVLGVAVCFALSVEPVRAEDGSSSQSLLTKLDRPGLGSNQGLESLQTEIGTAWEGLREGDYRNAYLAFRTAMREAKTDLEQADAALGAAQTLLVDGRFDESIDALSEWIDAYPTNPRQFIARILYARALELSARPGTSAAAVGAWHEVLYVGAVPCADAVRTRRAALLISLGRLEEASSELATAQTEVEDASAPDAARLLVYEAARSLAVDLRDGARAGALTELVFKAVTSVGRLPEDVTQAAWRVASTAFASGDRARAEAIQWQIIGEWPETTVAWQAVSELGGTRVPASARAIVAVANNKWESVRDATRWLLANAPRDPMAGQARALRGIAANALQEPDAVRLLDEGGVVDAGPRWGARAIWEAAERHRMSGNLEGAATRYTKLATTFPGTLEASQGNYQLGRILPGLGDVARATHAMNLAADVGPVGFHTVRARQVLGRTPARAPVTTDAFVASGAITPIEWKEWEAWLVARKFDTPATSRDLGLPDVSVAVGRLDALLASGLLSEAEDAAREVCQRRGFAPATVAAVAHRLRLGGHVSFSMSLGHRLLRILEAAGETSTLALPVAPKKLAYPLAYARLVADSAARENIDPYLLLALMKQESWFDPNAVSKANARGLTQFIRPTANEIARELKWPNWQWDDMFHPYVAVPFGARYLASLLRDFRGNALFATAAYNAGPGSAQRWVGNRWGQDADEFVAGINYRETRGYVTTIAAYAEVYRDTYGLA